GRWRGCSAGGRRGCSVGRCGPCTHTGGRLPRDLEFHATVEEQRALVLLVDEQVLGAETDRVQPPAIDALLDEELEHAGRPIEAQLLVELLRPALIGVTLHLDVDVLRVVAEKLRKTLE